MAVDLQTILGLSNLTGMIQAVSGGVPQLLPPAFFTLTRGVEGNTATYYKHEQTRQTAKLTDFGGGAHDRGHVGLTEVPVKLMHSLEVQRHKPQTLLNLMDPSTVGAPVRQRMGAAEIGRQVGEFARLFTNLRRASVYSTLRNGKIWFDGNGNLLPSSSGAKRTVDFGVPAGNQNQLDALGDGAIIGASWATAGTDIIGDVRAIQKASLALTGLPIRHALYGENIPNYLFTNTALKELISNNASLNAAAAQGRIPDPLLDLTWWDMTSAFFEDSANARQYFWGGDTVVFIPEPSREWWELIEGSLPIASMEGFGSDAVAALAEAQMVQGLFSVAAVRGPVPAVIEHFAGDTFLPTLMNPNAIFIADVTP